MRIGVDASSLIAQKTGIGSFASHLLENLEDRAGDLSFLRYRPEGGRDLGTPARLWWEGVELPRRVSADRAGVLYSPGFSPPPFGKFKKIVTVHDVIGLLYPSNVGPASRFYWSFWLPRNLKKADRLIASSECTKRDVVRLLKIPENRIQVVPLAVRDTFRVLSDPARVRETMARYGLRAPYFISVSSLEPRKNHLRLLRAFDAFRNRHPDFSLVIIGKPAGAEKTISDFIEEKGLGPHVKVLGYLPEEELITLYNGAHAYVMISLYEGFGLPALEAMRCGLTGVVADNSSLPEVTGDTALLAGPEDEAAMERAMHSLAAEPALHARLAKSSLERAGRFSIRQTAETMISIFRKEI